MTDKERLEKIKNTQYRIMELSNTNMQSDFNFLLNYIDVLKQQNKRYREAIEVAIHNMAASDNLGVKFALGILEQALEVEQ